MNSRTHNLPHFIPVLLLLSFAACFEAPKEPVAPTTDVQLSMPIADRTFLIGDFAEDEPMLIPTGDGYLFHTGNTIRPLGIETVEVELDTASEFVQLGSFVVQDPPPTVSTVTYRQITGFDPPPIPAPVPEASYTVPGTDVGPAGTFETITFESGTATLRIANTLPFPVDFPSGVRLRNNRTSAIVDTSTAAVFSFGSRVIPAGGIDSSVVDLAGITIQTLLRIMEAPVHTSGSGGVPLTIDAQDGLELRLALNGIRVSSALAMIPDQTILSYDDAPVTIDDSVSLQQALFRSGSFTIRLENTIDATVTVSVQLDELRNRSSGASFAFNHQFDGPGTYVLPVDLRSLAFESPRDTIGTKGTLSLGIGTIASTTVRQVNSTDYVRVLFEPNPGDPVTLEYLMGRITPTSLSAQQGGGIDLGELNDKFTGTITFDSVTVGLNLHIPNGFPFDYDLRLVGIKSRVSPPVVASIVLPPPNGSSQKRIFPGQNTRIELDVADGIKAFLESFQPGLPDSFTVSGSLLANPPDVFPGPAGRGSIYDTSKIYASYDISFPLKIGILGGEVTDTVALRGDNKIPDEFIGSTRRGTLYFQVTNGTPMGLTFRAAFLRESAPGVYDTLFRVPTSGIRNVQAGTVDPATGVVSAPRLNAFEISLSDADMQLYNRSTHLWFRFGLETAGGGAVPVKFRSTDYVRVQTSANLVYALE